jgi:FlaA1/EpsC-like NDP-sugar epimerase
MRWKGFLRRTLPFLLGDIALIALALYVSFWLRFDGVIPERWLDWLRVYAAIALAIKLPVFWQLGLYRMSWTHVSTHELTRVGLAVGVAQALLGALYFLLGRELPVDPLPRSVLLLDGLLTLMFVGGFRAAKRIYLGLTRRQPARGRRVLIVGAGDAGEQLLRAMLRDPQAGYLPIGFVDDDPAKQGLTLHGVRVLGTREEIPELVRRYRVEELLIAMPSAPSRVIKETVELGRQADLQRIRIVPGLQQLMSGRLTLEDVREVRLEDVLGREPVRVDTKEVERYLKGKRVLVTGAAGSIGSELCRQIAKFQPQVLIALDQDESGLFELEQELGGRLLELSLLTIVADICDPGKIERVFREHWPEVVFHAAAYKHVPLMETHPEEAVKNNIGGTLIIAEAALYAQSEKFVLISTDKAVNPTSVMGATKRVAEQIIQTLNAKAVREGRPTRYVAVRFGNVLGSRGSVFPLFQEQIQRGGPVTVTHPEMKRYFMTPSEAVLLVLQAGAMGRGGEVFVLDMGEPVSILELAREMIKLSGFEPDKDVPIVFTGERPGEKLFEELLTAEEGTEATKHEQIFVARLSEPPNELQLQAKLHALRQAAEAGDRARIVELLRELVPTYRPDSAELT